MRLAPVILIAIGVWGFFYPETLLAAEPGKGRWVFAIIILLGAWVIWRTVRRAKP